MQINPKQFPKDKVGGKAYQLVQLRRLFNVPSFFVVAFVSSEEIMDELNQRAIIQECHKLECDTFAVRSSGSCEDSADASFAGMFKTVLNVRSLKVVDAIREVLDSVNHRRVADYCEANGLDRNSIRMSVIVQKMVQSRVSGVCFTRVQGKPDKLLIEACYGLGDTLVSGKATPDTYELDRDSLEVVGESVGYQSFALQVPRGDGLWPVLVEIPFHKRNAKKLGAEEIVEVAKTCISIEQYLSFTAADVEWTYEMDKLFILQARTYTGYSNI